jgi:hypothetical protein
MSLNLPQVTVQFNELIQLQVLGFSSEEIKSINGKVLDLGCGIDARLVKFLRARGIDAEGIDPLVAREENYLMKLPNQTLFPQAGFIPRQDEYYKLIISHMCTPIYTALSDYSEAYRKEGIAKRMSIYEINHTINFMQSLAISTVMEALRVLNKKQGKYICFPCLNHLDKLAGKKINDMGFKIIYEDSPAGRLRYQAGLAMGYLDKEYANLFYYRTAIIPK